MDPFWASALIGVIRGFLSIIGSTITSKFKRRPVYLSSCVIFSTGLFSLSAYCYFNSNGDLTEALPIAKWIPIFSILIVYTGFSFGYGSTPFMLQVRIDTVIIWKASFIQF